MFTQKERKHLIISILVLGLAFGLNDKQPAFNIVNWTFNLVRAVFSAAIVLLLYELIHKFIARRYNADTEYELWSIRRYGFWRSARFPKKIFGRTIESFPLGVVLSILAALLSNGTFYLTPISSFKIIEKPHLRIGAKFRQLTNFEEAKIAVSSMLFLAVIALILVSLNYPVIFNQLVTMLFVFIAYSLIPFSSLDGAKIFFGSVPLYLATLAFILAAYFLIDVAGIFSILLIALLGAAFILLLYFNTIKNS